MNHSTVFNSCNIKMVKELASKRPYHKVAIEQKNELIYRVVILSQSTRRAARVLKLNYATAKVIIQKFKKSWKQLMT